MARYRQLDGLRGIAAASVMLHHFVWTRLDTQTHQPHMPAIFWLLFRVFHIFFSGRESVLIFFVLSGFVLGIAIPKRRPLRYLGYAVHRICRLYLPYLFSLVLAVSACYLFRGSLPQWTPSMQETWIQAPGLTNILEHLLFIGTYPQNYNSVYWTLVIEMRVSLYLPLIVWAIGRFGARPTALALAILTILDLICWAAFGPQLTTVPRAIYDTLHYSIFFGYGVWLAFHSENVGAWIRTRTTPTRYGLVASALIITYYVWTPLFQHVPRLNPDFAAAVGSCLLICIALYDRLLGGVLEHPVATWLGRISYSLYLVHVTVILVLSSLFGDRVPFIYLYTLGLVISLGLAELMSRFIERPSQHLGRYLDSRV